MWNNIKINNDVYIISVTQKDDKIKIFLTNLIEIWMETLTNEIILDRCQKLNPLLDVEALNYNEIMLDILNDVSKHTVEASVECIKLRARISCGWMKFALNLSKGTPQDFWEIITKPLCISGMEILRQHKLLLDLVKKKDDEIAEYKADGAELIRKNIETKVFTEEQLKINIPTPNTIDCTNAFQGMLNFYNEFDLWNQNTVPTERTSCSNSKEEIQQTGQNIVTADQDNNKSLHKNEDISAGKDTEVVNSESKVQNKDSTNKKVTNRKIGTANLVYRPVKKLKKEPEHLPEMLPRRENNKIKRKRCRQCTANGLRKETNYFCSGCKNKPGLCLGKCFKEYHKLM